MAVIYEWKGSESRSVRSLVGVCCSLHSVEGRKVKEVVKSDSIA